MAVESVTRQKAESGRTDTAESSRRWRKVTSSKRQEADVGVSWQKVDDEKPGADRKQMRQEVTDCR